MVKRQTIKLELNLLQQECLKEAISDFIDKAYNLYCETKKETYLKQMQEMYNIQKIINVEGDKTR